MAKFTNAKTQRKQLLTHLQEQGSITTIEARQLYDIMGVAPRILELKAQGHNIVTERISVITDDIRHVGVAKYILSGGHYDN